MCQCCLVVVLQWFNLTIRMSRLVNYAVSPRTQFLTYYISTGLVMIAVIIGSKKVGINPDNVATPIAASLGDLITLSLLAGVSSTLYNYIGEDFYSK